MPAAGPGGLPAALAAVGPAFVGRETEVAWLRESWADAVDGRGGFVSVLGPEGIGKTRLVAELARDVHADGAAVLYGRCDHAHQAVSSQVHPSRVHDAPVIWLAFSPDGRTMVSQAADGTFALSDATTGVPTAVVQPGPAGVGALAELRR